MKVRYLLALDRVVKGDIARSDNAADFDSLDVAGNVASAAAHDDKVAIRKDVHYDHRHAVFELAFVLVVGLALQFIVRAGSHAEVADICELAQFSVENGRSVGFFLEISFCLYQYAWCNQTIYPIHTGLILELILIGKAGKVAGKWMEKRMDKQDPQ